MTPSAAHKLGDAVSTGLACPTCTGEVITMPDGSLYCRGCGLPVDKAAPAGNGHRPEEIPASAQYQGIGGGGKHFQPVTADVLAASETPTTSWIWKGYAPQGGLILLCAPPKCGKTTLANHLARAVSKGRPFLGQASTKSPVLILAVEERRQDVANRARTLGLGGDVYLHTGPLGSEAIPAIASFVLEKHIGLVIIDTLPRFWAIESENDASMVNMAMAGILAMARNTNAAVFLLYHLRKSAGSGDGEEIRGSGDIFAQCDIALIMRRRKAQSNQRTIKSFSRYDATPDEIVIALEDGEYVHLGDSVTVRGKETDAMLLEALSIEPHTPEEIKEGAGLKLAERTLLRHYSRLTDAKLCIREGSGTKALPYRYKKIAATTKPMVVSDWQESAGDHPPDTEPEQKDMDIGKPEANVDGLMS